MIVYTTYEVIQQYMVYTAVCTSWLVATGERRNCFVCGIYCCCTGVYNSRSSSSSSVHPARYCCTSVYHILHLGGVCAVRKERQPPVHSATTTLTAAGAVVFVRVLVPLCYHPAVSRSGTFVSFPGISRCAGEQYILHIITYKLKPKPM